MNTLYVFTFAVPAVALMDIFSESVDFPWWAYLVLVVASLTRLTFTVSR